MKNLWFYAVIALNLLVLAGCSERHLMTIDPALPVSGSKLGNGMVIGLKVTDARKSNIIAQWRGRFHIRKFSVSPDRDIAETLQAKVASGLKLMGFQPKHYKHGAAERRFQVDILQVKSVYSEKIPHLGVKVRVALKATCKTRAGRYENVYRDSRSKRNIAPATFPNENLVNATISEALRKMFTDPELLDCLSG